MQTNQQERLPGVEGAIPELEELGFEYAAIRDERISLNKREVDLKQKLMDAMHRNEKTEYLYEDLEVVLEPGEEKLKVRVKKKKEQDSEPEAGTGEE